MTRSDDRYEDAVIGSQPMGSFIAEAGGDVHPRPHRRELLRTMSVRAGLALTLCSLLVAAGQRG